MAIASLHATLARSVSRLVSTYASYLLGFVVLSEGEPTVVRLPPLREAGDATPVGAAGLAFDASSALSFNEFSSQRLGRLARVE
jgi:hypothetical protein